MADQSGRIRRGIIETAKAVGINPIDLATAISYETKGTFNPTIKGPVTQYGQHEGLIQFGQPQARHLGINWKDAVGSQLGPSGAVAKYLIEAGVRPGMGLRDVYSAINAGHVGLGNRSDAKNGGAPGTVNDKVAGMADHLRNAERFMGGAGSSRGNFSKASVVDDGGAEDNSDVADQGPFPAAPPRERVATGPVGNTNTDRNAESRDTRKQPMDPNSLIQRMMAAGGRQSTNVQDMRMQPSTPDMPAAGEQGPSIADSPEFQAAAQVFMQHYGHPPATDSDFQMVVNLMKGQDMTESDTQKSVLDQMGEGGTDEEGAGPTDGDGNDSEGAGDQDAGPGDPIYDGAVQEWTMKNKRDPKTDEDFAEIDQIYKDASQAQQQVDPRQQILEKVLGGSK